MKPTQLLPILAGLLFVSTAALAQEKPAALAADEKTVDKPAMPILRLEADGPVSQTTTLTFSNDGKTLYAAGYDKAVYVWTRQADGTYQFLPAKTLRIPIGPGVNDGLIKSLAISPDGRYLAAAGVAMGSHVAGFTEGGLMWPASTQSIEQRKETGTIYVFDLESPRPHKITQLRGHIGRVTLLTFAPQTGRQTPVLVSAADEYNKETGDPRGVIRVWDINRPQESIAEHVDLPAPSKQNKLPRAIAAIRHGDSAKSIHVGITWGENVFRVWDVARDRLTMVNNPNSVACASVDNQFLLAGSYPLEKGPGKLGNLTLWRPPVANNGNAARIGQPLYDVDAPIGIVTGSATKRAMIVCFMLPGTKVGFFLADARTLTRLSPENGPIEFSNTNRRPAYAMSPQGDYIAVAGNLDRKIKIYKVKGDHSVAEIQTLEGKGDALPRVRFYAKGESLGLGLNTEARTPNNAAAPPELMFDITAGKVVDRDGWQSASGNSVAGFDITPRLAPEDNERHQLVINHNDGTDNVIITLPEKQTLFSISRCPQTDNHPPLVGVIVRSPEFAESILRIYNARTGERLREFSGHTDTITGITFSKDGKLMASASDDRTVRVWWLEDLKDHVGEVGFLEYLQLTDKQDVPTVKEIDKFAAEDIRQNLKEDDVITGFVAPGGKTVNTEKSYEFFYYLSTVKPGQTVDLLVKRDGRELNPRPKIQVQQAVDERKPLFTLFFKKGQPQQWSWIGWTPTGPFDSSDEQIENLVGWHFNPENDPKIAEQNVNSTFAKIGEYRKDNYTEGLLKNLIETGKPNPPEKEDNVAESRPYTDEVPIEHVPPAVAPKREDIPEPPNPQASLFVKERRPINDNGDEEYVTLKEDDELRVFANSKNIQAVFTVSGIPLEGLKDRLTWFIDDQALKANVLEPASGIFEADLSGYDWKKRDKDKPYELAVSFKTSDGTPHRRSQAIVFAPPPPPPPPPPAPKVLPNFALKKPEAFTVLYDQLDEKQLEVTVEFSPAEEGEVQPGVLSFERNGEVLKVNGKPITRAVVAETKELTVTLPIENGENRIRARLTSDDDKATKLSNEIVADFRRPPRVISLDAAAEKENPRAKVTSVIQTPVGLPLSEVLLLINRKMFMVPEELIQREQDKADKTRWTVTVNEVLLKEGENTIRIIPRNEDGRVLSTPKLDLEWKKPPPMQVQRELPNAPQIFFANVNNQAPLPGRWLGDSYTVQFNVLAPGELKRVLVYYNGERLDAPEIPAAKNGMKYEFSLPVRLSRSRNELRVIAQDANVRWSEQTVALTSLKPPVRLVIDDLIVLGKNNRQVLNPVVDEDGQEPVTFDRPAGSSTVLLRGRAITSDSTKKFQRPYLKCWVNGYLQWARAVQSPNDPTEWKFAVNLVLNKAKDNCLKLDPPEAPSSSNSQTKLMVDCLNPDTTQKLHLVMVGIDPKDPRSMDVNALKKEAIRAFGIQNGKTAAGNDVEVHVIPFSEVRASKITSVLKRIQVSKRNADKGEHQLVVFYYHGQEVQRGDKIVLRTFDRIEDKAALTADDLKNRLEEIHGAHVVMLDVAHPEPVDNEWKTGEFLGLLRNPNGPAMPNGFPLAQELSNAMKNSKVLSDVATALQGSLQNLDHNDAEDVQGLILE